MPGPYNFRRFKCAVCGRSDFKSQGGLKRHLNKLHPVFEDTDSSLTTSDNSPDDSESSNSSERSPRSHSGSNNGFGGANSPQAMGPDLDMEAEELNAHHDDSESFIW